MAILKLAEPNDEATLNVTTAEVVEGQYGEQVKFTTSDNDLLFVPKASVERQLDRCGVAEIEELSGKRLHFFRAPNSKPGSKPYWNIDKAREGDITPAPSTNGKPAVQKLLPNENGTEDYHPQEPPADWGQTAAPVSAPNGRAEIANRYRWAAELSRAIWGDGFADEIVATGAHTLFIAADKRNV